MNARMLRNAPPRSTIARLAPSAPPDDVPSRYGSAMEFRNNPCITTPAAASPAPTSIAAMTRGNRISKRISDVVSLPDMPKNGTPAGPKPVQITTVAAARAARTMMAAYPLCM